MDMNINKNVGSLSEIGGDKTMSFSKDAGEKNGETSEDNNYVRMRSEDGESESKVFEAFRTEDNFEPSIILFHKTSMKNNFIRITLKIDDVIIEHPHEYLVRNKDRIIREVNDLLRETFTGLIKLNVKFSIKMKKLCEDGSYLYDEIYITSEVKHINVKDDGISETNFSSIVDDIAHPEPSHLSQANFSSISPKMDEK